jgi:hypothetical protein
VNGSERAQASHPKEKLIAQIQNDAAQSSK